MKTIHRRNRSGSSLVITLTVLATLMVIVGVAAEYTTTVNRHVQRSNTEQTAISVADSAIEILFSNWRKLCSAPGSVTTAQNTNTFANIALPTAAQLNLPSVTNFVKRGTNINPNTDSSDYDANYTISNYKVIAVNAQWNGLSSASSTPEPLLGQLATAITSGTLAPTTPLVYNYIASADVTLPAMGPAGKVVAKVRRVFGKQQLSPWNFAIFYVDPLEIHPGPPFTVTGWVHTNSDLYTGHNTLTFADKVTYGSDWFVDFKPGETSHDQETPAPPNYLSNLPPARDQAMQPFGLDSTSIFSTTDTNPNNDSYHELIEQAASGYTDPLAGQRFYDQAAIKILINASNTVTIQRYDGKIVRPAGCSGSAYVCGSDDIKLYNAITGAIETNQPIQDNREGAQVRLTTLDISDVKSAIDAGDINNSGSTRWNGIIYIADTSATSGTRRGIRLKNGAALPSPNSNSGSINGLTIASANPVYIQGNYNTGTGTVPSNSTTNNDPTTPQSSGYTRRPSSVVADAVTILSNSWNDANAQLGDGLNQRIATYTTVNTAIISGIVPSAPVGGDGSYSGGAENFPRFLEDWGSGVRFTYYGSMVQIYNSRQSIGKWGSANVYNPPTRQWYFDTNFKVTPPPGSLMLYSYIKGKWTVLDR